MKQALQILKEIKNTSSTNDKISILSQYKDNEMLKCILNIVYNPRISTKIAKKKLDKDVGLVPLLSEMSDLDFLNFISKDCTGKDKDILSCQTYLMKFNGEERELVEGIITQNLSIGMDYKNINKSFGYNFIEFYECMLATNVDKVLDKIKDEDYFITQKLDGLRMIVVVDGNRNKTAYSRNGLIYEGLNSLLNELELDPNMIYDGELLYSDDTLRSDERFRKTNEVVRCKGEKDKNLLTYYIFDAVHINELKDNIQHIPYSQRREYLDKLPRSIYQRVVPILYEGKIDNKVFELLDEVVEQGNEGLMANVSTGIYEFGKRSKNILKFKKFHDVDLLCIGVEEGEGKYKGKLGKILVEYYGYEVGIGSGFTDEQREYFWNNKDEIINKIVQIKYFEESKDKEDNLSLRFPVFQRIRNDKGAGDISYD